MEHGRYCGRLVPADQLAKHIADEKRWSRRKPANRKISKQAAHGKQSAHGKRMLVEYQELPQSSVWTGAPWDHNYANLK